MDKIPKNVVRVTNKGRLSHYSSYVLKLFNVTNDDIQEKSEQWRIVHLHAMGKAIPKLISLAEIIKRSIPSLHQLNKLESVDSDNKTKIPYMKITLSLDELDNTELGYQAPIINK